MHLGNTSHDVLVMFYDPWERDNVFMDLSPVSARLFPRVREKKITASSYLFIKAGLRI
jgi:hypothetical protein